MSSQFSKNGLYFAQITEDGKIKIWETATSTFKQEFTPNLHLTTPCTCLHWIQGKSQTPGKKKKPRKSESFSTEEPIPSLALGTSNGALLLYSVASAQVETFVESNTSNSISCLTWNNSQDVFAGAEQFVLQFNLKESCVKSKWKTGNDKITAILIVPGKSRLLTASRTIKLWDLKSKENLKTFTGHSTDVTSLTFIPSENTDPYFVSGSKNDRILNCWSLNENNREKNAVASLLMEDIAFYVSVVESSDNTTNLAAVTRSGVVHIYQHKLNGKCEKPVKPKVTIQVASDTGQDKAMVTPIPIIATFFHGDASVMIAHGNSILLTFENVVPSLYEKVQCLVRKDPRQLSKSKEKDVIKVKQAVVGKNVEYLTPHTSNNLTMKRKQNETVKCEVPMEQRLENLQLNRLGTEGSVPKQDNLAQLLVQGLHSNDRSILRNVLCKRDENVIKNTIRRLPMPVIVPLLTELTRLVQGKTELGQVGVIWLQYLIQLHAGLLSSNPDLIDLLGPTLGTIQNRLTLLTPLLRLKGRLDLLVSQMSDTTTKETEIDQALLVYKDQGSSDSEAEENLELNLHSDSENEWVEEEDSGNDSNTDDVMKIDENNVSDSEMSM